MNKLRDNDLRKALNRREARRTKPEVPADFCDSIMQEIAPKKSRPVIWRWVAAAACLAVIVGIGMKMLPTESQTQPEKEIIAKAEEPATVIPVNSDKESGDKSQETEVVKQESGDRSQETEVRSQETEVGIQEAEVERQFSDPNLHYAAIKTTVDSTYQAPSRMNEFIAKMADYHEVEAVPLDCTGGSDSIAVSTAYVFEDNQELDLFGRLLQAACWYDSKTPGYLLNFSQQQFFFTLKDLHKHEKYLWIAERIVGGRILLFSTHSPIEADMSSACYQNYREQLTHTNFNTKHL